MKLADLQFESGDNAKAESNYSFIISENPKYVSAYVNYGFLSLSVNKDDKKAEKYYDEAIKLDPDNEQALLNKAGLMIYRKDVVKAKNYIEKVLKINPTNEQAKRLLKLL
ncbi:MAG: tetratricopeptide repeat protein [Bacteroidetes bacterium]|nr:tetratricopeptide repeat protein [Bacteroidota bacterium]